METEWIRDSVRGWRILRNSTCMMHLCRLLSLSTSLCVCKCKAKLRQCKWNTSDDVHCTLSPWCRYILCSTRIVQCYSIARTFDSEHSQSLYIRYHWLCVCMYLCIYMVNMWWVRTQTVCIFDGTSFRLRFCRTPAGRPHENTTIAKVSGIGKEALRLCVSLCVFGVFCSARSGKCIIVYYAPGSDSLQIQNAVTLIRRYFRLFFIYNSPALGICV